MDELAAIDFAALTSDLPSHDLTGSLFKDNFTLQRPRVVTRETRVVTPLPRPKQRALKVPGF